MTPGLLVTVLVFSFACFVVLVNVCLAAWLNGLMIPVYLFTMVVWQN